MPEVVRDGVKRTPEYECGTVLSPSGSVARDGEPDEAGSNDEAACSDHRTDQVRWSMTLVLLASPQEASHDDISCGSPLWEAAKVSEHCSHERSGRVGWTVLWGLAAMPLLVSAARRE